MSNASDILSEPVNIVSKVPSNWIKKNLVELCNPKQWKTISKQEMSKTGYPVFGANGFIGYYPEYNHDNETIAITCRGATCGTVNLVPKKTYITGNSMCLDNVSRDTDVKYLYYASSYRTLSDVISGSAQPQITGESLKFVILPIPPITEQKKIASILTSVDELIENTQKQIDKLQDLKKATINELLTRGISHTEFQDSKLLTRGISHTEFIVSKLGRIPKGWKIVSLFSLSKIIKRGPSLSCNTEGKGIRYITSGNLVRDEVSLEGDYKFLDNFYDIEKCRILENDLVLNCVNSAAKIGGSAVFSLNIDAIVGFNNYAITLNTDVCDPDFIHYFTKTHLFRHQLGLVIKEAINQVSFSTKDLDLIQIALPSKSEQSEISQNIDSIWKNEKTLMKKLTQTQSLKKSLMQGLLTGKLRVQLN